MDGILNWIGQNPLIVIIVIVVLLIIFTYNNLNAKRNRVKKSFSTIDVYLEKRFDLIGSLFDQLMAAYEHESDVYVNVSRARSGITKAQEEGTINAKVQAVNELNTLMASPAMSMIRTEQYPEMAAVKDLASFTMKQTASVEDDLSAARMTYNSNVTSYNTAITSFPNILLAGIMGFKESFELFKVSEEKKERPSTNMNDYRISKAKADLEIERLKKEADSTQNTNQN